MKKAVAIFCALLLVLLTACGKTPGAAEQNSDTNTGGDAEQTDTLYKKVDFKAKYVSVKYTDEIDDKKFPEQFWITSLSELRDYQKENAEKYGLDSTGYKTDFVNATKGYDNSFFEKHNLIFLSLQEGSSSIKHKVTKVKSELSHLSSRPVFYDLIIFYDRIVPEVYTCDMAQWLIMIEVDKK